MNQLINRICPYYTSKRSIENIRIIRKTCDICKKNTSKGQAKYGLMSQLGPATKPFQIMSIDTIGGFGGNRSTKRYLHLLVDHYTRYTFIYTSRTQAANDFIKIVQNTLQIYKIDTILTDQYPGVNTKEFKNFSEEQNIRLIYTALNAPFSNGLNERLNQTIVNKIRYRINESTEKKATTIASECVNNYNITDHSVTGVIPKYLLDEINTNMLPEELKKYKNAEDWNKDTKLAPDNTIKSHEYR